MTNKLIRANIQRLDSHSFDEYGDPNPVYYLAVNGTKLTLKTRSKKLPSGIDFSQKFEFIFDITPDNEIIAFYSPLQDLKWGNQTNIKTLTGSKKPKKAYQFISGTVTDKRSKSETVNTHLPKFGMENKTLENRTTYYINISGQTLAGGSSYRKIKIGDQVTGVTNQYGYLEMLKNTQSGKVRGLFPLWPTVIALVVTVGMNLVLFYSDSLNKPVKTAFGEYPEYYEKVVFLNLLAIPTSIMTILWAKERFRISRFHRQNKK